MSFIGGRLRLELWQVCFVAARGSFRTQGVLRENVRISTTQQFQLYALWESETLSLSLSLALSVLSLSPNKTFNFQPPRCSLQADKPKPPPASGRLRCDMRCALFELLPHIGLCLGFGLECCFLSGRVWGWDVPPQNSQSLLGLRILPKGC